MTLEKVKSHFDSVAVGYHKASNRFPWSIFRYFESRAFKKMIKNLDLSNVLELGCGSGFYTDILSDSGADKITVVDFSQAMLDQISNPKVIKHNDEFSKYQTDERYSLIVCMGAFEFSASPRELIAKYFEMLAPDGKLVFMMPSKSLMALCYRKFHKSHQVDISLLSPMELPREGRLDFQKVYPFSYIYRMWR